jgi:hypothetical protein
MATGPEDTRSQDCVYWQSEVPNLNEKSLISSKHVLHSQYTQIFDVSGLKCCQESQRIQQPRGTLLVKASSKTLFYSDGDFFLLFGL